MSAGWSTARGEDGDRHNVATETATHASRPTAGVALRAVASGDVFEGAALADARDVPIVGSVVGPVPVVAGVLEATDAVVPGDVVTWVAQAHDTRKHIVPSTVMIFAIPRTLPSWAGQDHDDKAKVLTKPWPLVVGVERRDVAGLVPTSWGNVRLSHSGA